MWCRMRPGCNRSARALFRSKADGNPRIRGLPCRPEIDGQANADAVHDADRAVEMPGRHADVLVHVDQPMSGPPLLGLVCAATRESGSDTAARFRVPTKPNMNMWVNSCMERIRTVRLCLTVERKRHTAMVRTIPRNASPDPERQNQAPPGLSRLSWVNSGLDLWHSPLTTKLTTATNY